MAVKTERESLFRRSLQVRPGAQNTKSSKEEAFGRLVPIFFAPAYHPTNVTIKTLKGQKRHTYARMRAHAHSLRFNGHFPGEPGLAGCPLNSPSPFIPGLCILLGQT